MAWQVSGAPVEQTAPLAPKLSRRDILRSASFVAGAAAMRLPATATPEVTEKAGRELPLPKAVKSTGGVLAVDLTCQPG